MPLTVTYYDSTNWDENVASTRTTLPVIQYKEGDTVVVCGLTDGTFTLTVPSGAAGVTLTQQAVATGSASESYSYIWSGKATSNQVGQQFSTTISNSARRGAIACWVISGDPAATVVNGTGDHNESNISLSTTAGSVVCCVCADFSGGAANTAPATGTGAATKRVDSGNANVGYWVADWVGTTAGSASYGPASYTGITTSSQCVVEVRARQSSFPTTGVLDNFNRANGAVGANWTRMFTNSGLLITSNAVGNDGATGAGEMYYNPITPGPDVEVYATWSTIATAILLWARVGGTIPDQPNAYAMEVDAGSTSCTVSAITAGTNNPIGGAITITTPAAGHKFGMSVIGNTITVYQDTGSGFVAKGTKTDSTYPGAGRIGMSVVGTGERVDDFGGGTVVALPTNQPQDYSKHPKYLLRTAA